MIRRIRVSLISQEVDDGQKLARGGRRPRRGWPQTSHGAHVSAHGRQYSLNIAFTCHTYATLETHVANVFLPLNVSILYVRLGTTAVKSPVHRNSPGPSVTLSAPTHIFHNIENGFSACWASTTPGGSSSKRCGSEYIYIYIYISARKAHRLPHNRQPPHKCVLHVKRNINTCL